MDTTAPEVSAAGLRAALLDIARKYERLGAEVAAAAPYWAPSPSSAIALRAAAEVLRAEVELTCACSGSLPGRSA